MSFWVPIRLEHGAAESYDKLAELLGSMPEAR